MRKVLDSQVRHWPAVESLEKVKRVQKVLGSLGFGGWGFCLGRCSRQPVFVSLLLSPLASSELSKFGMNDDILISCELL